METETHMADLLLGGFVMLGAALVMVLVFRRFGIGAVLGYLIAGILIGPQGFELISNAETILEFSEIGIILLLFIVGLELAPARLMRLRQAIFGLGMSQVVLCGIALFLLIMATTNFTLAASIAIGLPLALSSTAQVLPMLQSSGRLNTPTGEKSFSILLFQDLSIIPLLTIIAALSRAPQEDGGQSGWLTAVYAVLAIGGLILAGKYLLQPLLKVIGRIAERELFIVAGLVAVFGSAALMEFIGLSPALGAFLAGVMLANSPYRHELEADIDPFRSLLLGFFFLAVGMMLDLDVVMENPLFIIGAAIALVTVKIAIIFGLGKLFGMDTNPALAMGMLLSQGGEFGFVLFSEAEKALLIEPEASSLFGAIITISMATTPFLMLLARRFSNTASASSADLDDPGNADRASVIVVGQGRFGQTVSQVLMAAKIPLTLIDIKPEQIDVHQQFGAKVFYGDGTRVDLLRRAGAHEADAIVFCMDDKEFGSEQVRAIIQSFPETKIFVRVYDRRQLIALKGLGIAGMKREMFESAVHLARQTMFAIDLDSSLIEEVDEEFRQRDCDRLEAQLKSGGDMLAGAELRFENNPAKKF
ncbi:cation:proton antiporter [Parasphingorhabdus flavimaris]|uniref:Cation:proton antiporter n=1 Tax=Parasphingorhabdus flavimaris TaxID=266812 RepID=A0ABX2MZC5_9SPHN|nr:monovalent cation:proton antiporter-2 (CPA2) family protein [Parasphingorhabdus flavimaris]NVD26758.1 cation:proton antiporter [Parasphingorhabdus flavimaris]|tara:strand:+ start:3205 stop:4971 length:1767 start_codon:yes stop_codon:yes gene_type:complete